MGENIIIGKLPTEPKKIAGFDLDWTLIRPDRKKISEHGMSHSFLPNRLSVLLWFIQNEYTIIIISNQKVWNKFKIKDAELKLNWVHETLRSYGISSVILAATENNEYRKPAPGWKKYLPKFLPDSFYCGDAAGRAADFSNSDKKFAEACGLFFRIPEEVFPPHIPNINIGNLLPALIVCVGAPGSGKTTYAKKLEAGGWIRISSDDHKSNCIKIMKVFMSNIGKRVIIDATNPKAENRAAYIQIALANGMKCYILHFLNHGEGRNSARNLKVLKIVYSVYWSNFDIPSKQEKAEIHQIE